jgi:hypothetical protein
MSKWHWPARSGWTAVAFGLLVLILAAPAAAATEARVTVGSPLTTFPQNKQNEPAVAIDASRPSILAAGANDEIDIAPCARRSSRRTSRLARSPRA